MRAGELRHLVTIQQAAISQGTDGAAVETWSTFATVYASVEPLVGKEMFASKQVQSQTTHRIRIRHLAGVTSSHRVLFDGRVFNITEVLNLQERNAEMQILAFEGAGA